MIQDSPTALSILSHIRSFNYREHQLRLEACPPSQWADPYEERLFFGVLGYEHAANEEAIALLSDVIAQSNPAQDVAMFYLAMTLKRVGDNHSAANYFLQAFRKGMRLPPALLEAALLLYSMDQRESSVLLLEQLIQQNGDLPTIRGHLTFSELEVYNEALSSTSTRIAKLIQPCALLGDTSRRLTERQSKILASVMDTARDAYESGTLVKPELAGRWQRNQPKPLRVMLIFSRHINCSERFIENDIRQHLESSAVERGHIVNVFHADRILYGAGALPITERVIDGESFIPSTARTVVELRRLAETISDFSPDIVMFEANFTPTETTITPQWLGSLPERRNFGLIAVVPDQNDGCPDFAGAWTEACDFVIGFDDRSRHSKKLQQTGKFLYFPTLPHVKNPHAHEPKEHDFIFIGSMTRGRDAILCRVARAVPKNLICVSDRKIESSPPSLKEYYRTLASGKATFNTGHTGTGTAPIRTGRVQEAVLARTALLEESYAEVSRTLIPHVHFLPVDNSTQVVCWSQYLAENSNQWKQMVDSAFDFTEKNYSTDHFWSMVESAVDEG